MDGPSIWRTVIRLALPTLAQQSVFFFIQFYDQYLAGKFSAQHQAALTTANYLYWFFTSYSVVVTAGATALVGRAVGAKDWRLAHHATAQVLLLAFLVGGSATLATILGMDHLLSLLQLEGDAQDIAMRFLLPLAAILALQLIETSGIACLVGAGDTKSGMLILVGVAIINVPTAWILSGGGPESLNFGFVGIAMGTALSHSIGGLAVLFLLMRGRSGLKVHLQDLLPNRELLHRLLRVSVPAALDSLSSACCQLWFLSIVNGLGSEPAAAHGIAIRWEGMGYLAGAAFAPAAMAIVAQNLGANQPDQAAKGARTAFLMGAAVMSFMGVLFFIFARPMCELNSPNNANVVELGVQALRLIAFAMPAVASWIILTASLRAAGDTRVPVLFTWSGFLGIRIPLAYFLTRSEWDFGSLGTIPAYDLGLFGAWIAMVVDLYYRGSMLLWWFLKGHWKTREV